MVGGSAIGFFLTRRKALTDMRDIIATRTTARVTIAPKTLAAALIIPLCSEDAPALDHLTPDQKPDQKPDADKVVQLVHEPSAFP